MANLTDADIVRIKDLTPEATLTKTHKIAVDKSTYVDTNASVLVSQITDIAVAEANLYTDAKLTGLKPKGNLAVNFSSISIDPDDYDCYYITVNNIQDTDTAQTFKRGLIYWLTNQWEVLYSESYLQAQITAYGSGNLVYAGVLSADFDVTVLQPVNGSLYYVTKRIHEVENDVYYVKGLIYFSPLSSQAYQITEDCKSQDLVIDASNQVTVTDFTLTKYQLIDNDTFQKSNTTVLNQVITYPGGLIGSTVTVLNLA